MSENETVKLPQRRFYRQRAHSNPLAHHVFDYPIKPSNELWDEKYDDRRGRKVTILDIGCGYGGLLIQLAKHFPDELLLGLEIRVKVSFWSETIWVDLIANYMLIANIANYMLI